MSAEVDLLERRTLSPGRIYAMPRPPANLKAEDRAKYAPMVPDSRNACEVLSFPLLHFSWNGYYFDEDGRLMDFSFNPRTSAGVSQKIEAKTRRQFTFFGKFPLPRENAYLVSDRSTGAFYHWMIECLPKIFLVMERDSAARFILPSRYRSVDYIQKSLELLGSVDVEFMPRFRVARIAGARYVTNTAPLGRGLVYHDGELLTAMATRMLASLPGSRDRGAGERLFISRAKAPRRRIVNEDEIERALVDEGFRTVHFEELSLHDQIRTMANASVVVSLHGAGLSNMMFMPAGGTVLEVTGRHINDITYFQLARALGHEYFYLNGEPQGSEPVTNQHPNLIVPVDELIEAVRRF